MPERFIEYLKARLGDIYVWGAQGETDITEKWIRKKETSSANARRAIALWEKRKQEGRDPVAAFDCSGLIVRFLLDNGLIKGDLSSRGLYSLSEKLNSRNELVPGDLLFRHDGKRIHHVGVYIGDGLAIEAKGRDDGVVMRELNASGKGYWNRYGRLKELSAATDEPNAPQGELPAMYEYAGATYVNLRTGPGTEYSVIGRVSRGDRVLVLQLKDGWAEVIKQEDGGLRGFCTASHLEKARN